MCKVGINESATGSTAVSPVTRNSQGITACNFSFVTVCTSR